MTGTAEPEEAPGTAATTAAPTAGADAETTRRAGSDPASGSTPDPAEGPAAGSAPADRYLEAAVGLLQRARQTQAATLARAGALVADTVAGGGALFAHGAGHSSLAAQDLVYRSGGLALVNLLAVPGATGVDAVPAPFGSALERVSGLARAALDTSPARAGDLLFVVSLSGRNALPVEMASHARALGLTVIGVTSLAYARRYGATLREHCDLVLDTGIAVGDAELTDDRVAAPFAPASTVVAAALLQATVAQAVGELADRGVEPPLLRSGNVDGGAAWNERVHAAAADRVYWRHPPRPA
ncbi:SIS domain-containing protein [Streptomyces sp. 4N509B]|uniref:SIS domain-containing protein n=1 Tax=Streptomyces sp. 4N509B TaxID=3457413 RepID=UPI003FD005C3